MGDRWEGVLDNEIGLLMMKENEMVYRSTEHLANC